MPSQPSAQACLKNARAVALEMLVEGNAVVNTPEELGER
jgi:hypothetical protein